MSLVRTAHAGHDGRTCNAGITQRRVYGPVGREPDETKDRSQLQCFVRRQRREIFLAAIRIGTVLPNGRVLRRALGYAGDKRHTSISSF